MKTLKWKRLISVGLGVITLFIGSVGLTSCNLGGESEEVEEQEVPSGEEEEEDDDDDDD
ncbi:MAG: hypothetical protein AAGF26_09885 [Cyanobacteria bacterium P01_G01_bin.49]